MSDNRIWPVTAGGPVSCQLAEIAAGLRFAARNPGILNLDHLAGALDQLRDTAHRQEQALDAIVGEHAEAERNSVALAAVRRRMRLRELAQ